MSRQRSFCAALVCAGLSAGAAVAAQGTPGTVPGTFQGPSSSQTPYVVPRTSGWESFSILTVGDPAVNGYRMVGIPDGLGALAGRFVNGRYVDAASYMTVFMNHELGATAGIPRAHGQPGSFVSKWTIALDTLTVTHGEDLIQNVQLWDSATGQHVAAPAAVFGRLCSADLPAPRAFYNPSTRRGFDGRIYMNGEEVGAEGRAFGHVVTGAQKGTSFELPHLGRFSWENSVPHPNAGDRTVVIGLDDSTPGQIYVYRGTKQSSGNPVRRAGLVGGKLYGIRVLDGGPNYRNRPVALENNGAIEGRFVLQDVSDVAVGSGTTLQSTSVSRGVTEFARPEDGAWDPSNPRVFYFVTTGASIDGKIQSSKLYKLTFDDVGSRLGGRIQLVIDRASLLPNSSPLFPQFDNMTVASNGHVFIQEDTGNNPYLARIWRVNPKTETATELFQSDPARFLAPAPPPFNEDEEHSGIIEVTSLVRSAPWFQSGRRYFLGDTQAHYPIPGELVEGGQFYLLASPAPAP
jgi:hypothetical protein